MAKVIIGVLLVVLAGHGLLLLGLLGYAGATDRLDTDKMEQYKATWRGEKLVAPVEEEEVIEEEESPQQASARIAEAEIEKEALRRDIQRKRELLTNMQAAIAAARDKLDKDRKQLDADQELFAKELKQQQELAEAESFRKVLTNYTKMKPAAVKDDFMHMEEEDVVRYLAAMPPGVSSEILGKFKTLEEQAKRRSLLAKLKEYGKIELAQK